MESTIIKRSEFVKSKTDSNSYYHSQPSISASGLKQLKESPAHFKESRENPQPQTDAMYFGELYHTYILEPDSFSNNYQVVNPANRPDLAHGMTAKVNKAWMESFKNPVSLTTLRQLQQMKDVLFRHPYAKSLLTNGEVEASYYGNLDIGAKDPINIRFRPDNVKHNKRLIIDLKTTQNASKDEFPRSAAKFGYHIQAAFYSDMMELATGETLGYDFFFVAQEKTPPYAFNIFQASPQFLSVGRYEYEILLMLYAYCMENDRWPGYQVFCQNKYGVNELTLPPYAIKEIEFFTHKL